MGESEDLPDMLQHLGTDAISGQGGDRVPAAILGKGNLPRLDGKRTTNPVAGDLEGSDGDTGGGGGAQGATQTPKWTQHLSPGIEPSERAAVMEAKNQYWQ